MSSSAGAILAFSTFVPPADPHQQRRSRRYADRSFLKVHRIHGFPTGCVVAGRLAYADPNLKVMLIEGKLNLLGTLEMADTVLLRRRQQPRRPLGLPPRYLR